MKPWNRLTVPDPGIPTMISPEERVYLYWLSSQVWAGRGHIVEIGPWLGGSTYCLASGMTRNGCVTGKRLHTFDDFIWRSFMDDRASETLQPGESFLDLFRANLQEFDSIIVAHRQALPEDLPEWDTVYRDIAPDSSAEPQQLTWTCAEPVEILFIDGAKSWGSLVYLLREFCDSLMPGRTLHVCQDYKYWGEYWVALVMEYLGDSLELVHNLTWNTVTFRVTRPIREQDLRSLPDLAEIGVTDGLDRLDKAADRLRCTGDSLGALVIESTKIRFLAHKGLREAARSVLRRLEACWPTDAPDGNLRQAGLWLNRATGIEVAPLWRTRMRSVRRAVGAAGTGRMRRAWREAKQGLTIRSAGTPRACRSSR